MVINKTLEEISGCSNANIKGGFAKACADINEYTWQHGTRALSLYLERWLNSKGKLSYQIRKNEMALISKDADEETIMFIIDGLLDEIKFFYNNELFEHHTREVTWYFEKGVLVSKKVEEY
jgi:hypothetical protein